MAKKIVIAVIMVAVVAGGAWYYFNRISHAPIEKILANPRAYEGKLVTLEGEVTERTSFFGVVKFFKVRDKTGEIIVVTKRVLPEAHSQVRVKGKIDEVFSVGDEKLLVFVEESVEKEGGAKNP
jgi:hypothetical protein